MQVSFISARPGNVYIHNSSVKEQNIQTRPEQGSVDSVKPQSAKLILPALNRTVHVEPVDIPVLKGLSADQKKEKLNEISIEKAEQYNKDVSSSLQDINSLFESEIAQAFKDGKIPNDHVVSVKDASIILGYFKSPRHQAFAELASARAGGVIPEEWFLENEPMGGCPGGVNNDYRWDKEMPSLARAFLGYSPKNEAEASEMRKALYKDFSTEEYLRNTGIAHDVDLVLGRYFNAGPMAPTYKTTGPVPFVGIAPHHALGPDIIASFENADMPVPDYIARQANQVPGWTFEKIEQIPYGTLNDTLVFQSHKLIPYIYKLQDSLTDVQEIPAKIWQRTQQMMS
jgi:hypothetical protein